MLKKRDSWEKRILRSPVISIFLLLIIALILVNLFKKVGENLAIKREIIEKEKKIAEMEKRKEELLKTEKRLATPIVQEKEIRQRLGLGKPGEKVIFISSLGESNNSLLDEPKKNSLNSKKNNPQKWWDYFFSKE